jgi:nucleotide-binding universal stress UspA family protein
VDDDRIEPRPDSSWPERIVVGVDTSVESLAALQCAVALAMRAGSTLVAVHASGTADSRWGAPDIDGLVRRVCTREGCPDVLIGRSIVEAGPPADALIRAAGRVGGDLLVVGRRGLGAAASSLGSTSEAVLDGAGVPVLIVPSRCSTDTVAARSSGRSAASPSDSSTDVVE